ncbi:MAG: type I phosphomannose isomerase catalytic subunit [Bacteroidota bacterium]
MNDIYPLKFEPIFKDKIWGGDKIKTKLGLDFDPLPNCGEVWVLSGVEDNASTVTNGFLEGNELNELVEVFMGDLVGDNVYNKFGNEFPILIKFIDANDYLSIQVHPDDELAAKRHSGFGKSEMWYIIDADKDAELITGFKHKSNKEEYLKHLEDKTLKNILNSEKVTNGDVFYIPAGRVHALGPGLLLAEIQQSSDTTYRIYDWDRVDDKGNHRELHTELALDAIDFDFHDDYKTIYSDKVNKTVTLVNTPFFNTNIIHLTAMIEKDYEELDSFVIYTCTEGTFELIYDNKIMSVSKGEVVLIPNIINKIKLKPLTPSKILETFIIC